MREDELALLVFEVFDVNLNGVSDFEVGVVAKFADGDDTVALRADAYHHFALGDVGHNAFCHFVLVHVVEGLVVGSNETFVAFAGGCRAVFKCVPVEIGQGSNVFKILHLMLGELIK